MTRKEKRNLWEDRLAAFEESDQPATKWCQENEINLHSFRYWKKKLRSELSTQSLTNWVSVEVEESCYVGNAQLSIQVGRASIEVPENFNQNHLANVLKVVQATC